MVKKEEVKREEGKSHVNNCGVVGVVLGILSIVNLGGIGILYGLVGFFFGLKQSKISKNRWSKWGMILSVIGIVGGLIMIYVLVNYIGPYIGQFQQLQQGIPLQ